MPRRSRALLSTVFALTGFSALTLQVVWQRVISLHAGVDLVSFTTVVAAFLAGIGVGSLAGGAIADRVGPHASIRLFALANIGIGAFSVISVWLFYDVYQQHAASLTTPPAKFAFNAFVLAVPTTLMGLSLPLVAKGVVARRADAGSLVGRLYAANTLGAALGAATTGWLLLGVLGFTATTRLAGALNLVAAAMALALPLVTDRSVSDAPGGAPLTTEPPPAGEGPVWPWYAVYALTGAAALGFEIVFFRIVDTAGRSNSYTFAHVLSLYLALYGLGAAVAARVVGRVRRPGTWFLWIEFAVGASALAGLVVLTRIVPRSPWAGAAQAWFGGGGFVTGFSATDGATPAALAGVLIGVPLILMGMPVVGMGAAFPFAQALVARRLDTLGRHTGRLMFANVVGNVAGTLLVGFVALDRLGTAGTYRLLGLALLAPGVVAAWHSGRRWRGAPLVLATAAAMLLLVVALPANEHLYARLHGVSTDAFHLAEDRSCAGALRVHPSGVEEMTVNAAPQNDYPFDDFHLLLGLTAQLLHDRPRHVMALGLGIGATPYGMSLDPRVETLRTVELCGGQVPLLQDLAARRSPELRRLFADPRLDLRIGDGRDDLLRATRPYDVVAVDTLRPQAAFSGSLYSTEFYRLVHDRLGDDGLLAQWVPTDRTLNSVLAVFPHVVQFRTGYHGSVFFIAAKRPVTLDRAVVLRRAVGLADPTNGLTADQRAEALRFLEHLTVACVQRADGDGAVPDELVNRDLRPRDEYFLNQPGNVGVPHACQPPGTDGPPL